MNNIELRDAKYWINTLNVSLKVGQHAASIFYVIGKYVDSSYRFAGVSSFIKYLIQDKGKDV